MRTKTTLSEQFQNPIAKYVERGNIETTDTQIHDCWLSTITSINSGDSKLVLWSQTFQKLGLFCTAFMLKWNDSEALATWTSVRVSFYSPLFACMICFNFVIACWLYCFNVDVFVFFLYSVKSLCFCLYYMPNWNKVFFTYLNILFE
jgi:hypothetical protein